MHSLKASQTNLLNPTSALEVKSSSMQSSEDDSSTPLNANADYDSWWLINAVQGEESRFLPSQFASSTINFDLQQENSQMTMTNPSTYTGPWENPQSLAYPDLGLLQQERMTLMNQPQQFSTQGHLTRESRQPHCQQEVQGPASKSALQGSSKGSGKASRGMQTVSKSYDDSKAVKIYSNICHSKSAQPKGHPDKAKLYIYGKKGEFHQNIDGFSALVRLHRASTQDWAANNLTVKFTGHLCQDDADHSTEPKDDPTRYHRRKVREHFCGKTLWAWYKGVLKSLKDLEMDPETASNCSELTIEQILKAPNSDIAKLISWERLAEALTTSAQGCPIQPVTAKQVMPRSPVQWTGTLEYAPKLRNAFDPVSDC